MEFRITSSAAASKEELGLWREGVFEKSSRIDMSLAERAEAGVPASEEGSLVGDSDLARSELPPPRISSTLFRHVMMGSGSRRKKRH